MTPDKMYKRAAVLSVSVLFIVVQSVLSATSADDQVHCNARDAQGSSADLFVTSNQTFGKWSTKVKLMHDVQENGAKGASPPVHLHIQRTLVTTGKTKKVALEATLTGSETSTEYFPSPEYNFSLTRTSNQTRTESHSLPPTPAPCSCPECPQCSPCQPCAITKKLIPPGYKEYQGLGHYKLHLTPVTWFEAKATCEREGAYLAVMNSKREADMVAEFFKKYPIPFGHYGIRVGFHDLLKEGEFYTVLGQTLQEAGFSTWKPGEPNGGTRENCGVIWPTGQLNDKGCNTVGTFLCEL